MHFFRSSDFLHGRQAFVLVLAASMAAAAPTRGQDPRAPGGAEEARAAVSRVLEESYPDRPEWLDMLTDIIRVDQLGPNDGWFRRAVAQTRFDWKSTRERLDHDKDGKIDRKEFPSNDGDFARLDRDRDQALTEGDFDFSTTSPAPSPGSILFSRADRDSNGKVTREEFDLLFRAIDGGGQGFLSLSDLQEAFRIPPRAPGNPGTPGGPNKETLIRSLFRQDLGSLQPGPALNESAPDFTLRTNDGAREITLSKLVGPGPVVLVFGNFTCGPFRSHAGNFAKLLRAVSRTARRSSWSTFAKPTRPTAGGWRATTGSRSWPSAQPQHRRRKRGQRSPGLCGARTLEARLPDACRHDRRRRQRPIQRHPQPALSGRLAVGRSRTRAGGGHSASSPPNWSNP